MRFKTKDLLVTVLPKATMGEELAKACLLHTAVCINPTLCTPQSGCPVHTLCQNPTLCHNPSLCHYPTLCQNPSVCQPTVCHTLSCHYPSVCGPCSQLISCLGCSLKITHITVGCGFGNSCGAGGSACDPTDFCFGSGEPWVIEHLEDLVSLRADLRETVAQLDRIEKAGDLTSSIKTRAEAEALEASLTEALKNVQAAKKGLK